MVESALGLVVRLSIQFHHDLFRRAAQQRRKRPDQGPHCDHYSDARVPYYGSFKGAWGTGGQIEAENNLSKIQGSMEVVM
jgi:hypothetical protein